MNTEREQVFVWSKNTRLFHWINVTAILLLITIGVIILNSKTIGISTDGKILLKTIHVLVGYIFAVNLILRIALGFIGKSYEKWNKALPFCKGFKEEVYKFRHDKKFVFKGHNPAGKLMVLALLSLMFTQMVSGLVIAGTDIYYPPLGGYFVQSIAIDKNNTESIEPYSKVNVDEKAYKKMRELRKPFITAHIYGFYGLILLIPLHVIGVIVSEKKEKSALISAMVNGIKYLPKNQTEHKKKEAQ